MESISVDGTPFSILMDRAVKLKALQTKHEQEKYDKLPAFYQNTLFACDSGIGKDVIDAREKAFEERLNEAVRIKEEGNSAFQEGRLKDAISKYESALSIFRYLENTNPDWKTEGINDAFIEEHSYEGSNNKECKQIKIFITNCYNNIALVSQKMANFPLAIEACDTQVIEEE